MKKLQHFMAIAGSILVIASCHDANSENDAMNNVADEQSIVDTVPKRSDTTGMRDSTRMGDTTRMRDTTRMGDTTSPRYIDLRTGQPVELYYDPKARTTYSAMNNEPVEFYVDMNTGDTVYGRGRYVVNNYITRSNNGMYKLNAAKVKMEKDEIKIKEGNKKFKMDMSNMKMKEPNVKMKGDTTRGKMKSGDMNRKMRDTSSMNRRMRDTSRTGKY
jgi:hypothetical protein